MKKPYLDKGKLVKTSDNALLGDLVRDYVGIKAQIEALEKEMAPIKKALTDAVLSLPGGKLEIDGLSLSAVIAERETFKLKEALEVLDKRSLNPFISIAKYPMLTVRRKL